MLPRIQKLNRTYRHFGRYRQIVTVLARHGFGEILQRTKIEHYLELGLQRLHVGRGEAEVAGSARRLRNALEELGPTFVKVGQLLSGRPDVVPPDIVRELEKLQDHAPTFDSEQARGIIETELGRNIEEIFDSFDFDPLAAASLAQVHGAVLRGTGQRVVVKVQRPGVREVVHTDLEILEHLAGVAERHIEELQLQRPSAVVAQLRHAVEKELDYTVESAHLVRFARMFDEDPGVRVPEVFPEWTTSRVLTMERLEGRKVGDVDRSEKDGFDPEIVARRGADAVLTQIFVYGFFHADPHPGNVLILPDNVVGFVDLGQVGRLDVRTRTLLADLLGALTSGDEVAAADALLEVTASDTSPDRRAVETDLAEFIDWQIDRSLGKLEIGQMVWKLLRIASRHQRVVPPDLFLALKALGTLESLSRALDPSFDLSSRARPILRRLAYERFAPARLGSGAWKSSVEFARLLREIPTELREILAQVRSGKLKIEFEHQGLAPALHTHETTVDRLSFSVILAALLIASSLLVLGDVPPKWNGIPVIGLVGYLVGGVIGLGLLWSILRRGRL